MKFTRFFSSNHRGKFKTETLRLVLFNVVLGLAKLNSSNLKCIHLDLPSVTRTQFIGRSFSEEKHFFIEFIYYLYCSSPWSFSNGRGTGCIQQEGTMCSRPVEQQNCEPFHPKLQVKQRSCYMLSQGTIMNKHSQNIQFHD